MIRTLVLVVGVAVVATACTPFGRGLAPVPSPDRPDRTPEQISKEAGQLVGRWQGDAGASIAFLAEGTVRGNDGCDDFQGTWQVVKPGRVGLVLTSTSRQCVAAASLVLDDELAWQRDGERLTLTTDSGDVADLTRSD